MSVVWHNGNFVDQLKLDPAERGFMLGDGIFETIAVRNGRPIWLAEHLRRMSKAAEELALPFGEADIRFAVAAALRRSASANEVLRITLARGPTPRGLAADGAKPSLVVSLNPFDQGKLPAAMRLATSTVRRSPTSPASRLKTLSYIDAIAAAREVKGRADDALMLNTEGTIASTTVANLFLLTGKKLVTPSPDQGILPGITREKLLSLPDLKSEQRQVAPKELFKADAVFITNSLRLAVPLSSLDDKPCGTRDISFINAFLERSFT